APTLLKPKGVKHEAPPVLKAIPANQSPAVAQLASAGTATKHSNPLPEGEAAGVVVTTPTQQDALPLKSFQTPDRLNPAAVYQPQEQQPAESTGRV
ncbi:unnamed protein product, partial [Heterosigma akashiwo]